jgi:DNA modification methylase
MPEQKSVIYEWDSLLPPKMLEPNTFDCLVTSPPYFQMVDYGHPDQLGHEKTVSVYLFNLRRVFSNLMPYLKNRAVLAINIADTQNALSPVRGEGQRNKSTEWSHRRPLQEGYAEGASLNIPGRLVAALQQIPNLHFLGQQTWDKGSSYRRTKLGPRDSEPILFFVYQDLSWDKRLKPLYYKPWNSSIMQFPTTGNSYHIAPYPIPLVSDILQHICPPEGHVIDPFIGSGSTYFAAQNYGAITTGFDLTLSSFGGRINKLDPYGISYPRKYYDDKIVLGE